MAKSDVRLPQDTTPAGSSKPERAWFPPKVQDFEITPEAAMYAGRR